MSNQKVLFIACLPHSGSTLTSLLLGHLPNMIGVGSLDKAIYMISENPEKESAVLCTCGSRVGDCHFWSSFVSNSAVFRDVDFVSRYSSAIQYFQSSFGKNKWLVDSSKLPDQIKKIHLVPNTSLHGLHICRDFRSSIVSTVDLKRKNKNLSRPGWIIGIEAAIRWQRRNNAIRNTLSENKIPFLGFGYEEICLGLAHFAEQVGIFLRVLSSLEKMNMVKIFTIIEKQVYKKVTHFGGQISKDSEVLLRGYTSPFRRVFERSQPQDYATNLQPAS